MYVGVINDPYNETFISTSESLNNSESTSLKWKYQFEVKSVEECPIFLIPVVSELLLAGKSLLTCKLLRSNSVDFSHVINNHFELIRTSLYDQFQAAFLTLIETGLLPQVRSELSLKGYTDDSLKYSTNGNRREYQSLELEDNFLAGTATFLLMDASNLKYRETHNLFTHSTNDANTCTALYVPICAGNESELAVTSKISDINGNRFSDSALSHSVTPLKILLQRTLIDTILLESSNASRYDMYVNDRLRLCTYTLLM